MVIIGHGIVQARREAEDLIVPSPVRAPGRGNQV